ncbi:heparinase II/III-like family protein [Oceanobacillus picturae]|uniref:Heparinase II/III-like family protein n=1 Tax=Oceanobacillus picturae TaxID=171693 RepID=A0A0U9HY85_9BACI|nr:heparinase II/III family protein [Oceanobacillus picturae]GAQ16781.1 heparinase II/III-like family protein [Oceanobacillus picturae]
MIFQNTINGDAKNAANEIINNELFIHPTWNTIPFSNDFNWNVDPYNNRTWCFYLHSLSPVNYLVSAYSLQPEEKYLIKAKEIIHSWINFNAVEEIEPSIHAWNDHSTANRVVTLIFFWVHYKDSEIYDPKFVVEMHSLLKKHGEFLYDDNNYNFRNNHGAYQDRALIELSILFPDMDSSESWFNKGIKRLSNYINKFVSNEGVHKEHSAAYHLLMIRLLSGINKFLKYHQREITSLTETINKMEEYLAHIVKPNGELPMTGDSGPDKISYLKKENIHNPKLLYVRTNGSKGEKPLNSIVYKKDGIAVFRDGFNSKKSIYLNFIAAFNSLTHKHADDLSFLLSIGKSDFFTDSGKYNYQEQNEYRKYFRSTLAHNSITVNRKTFDLKLNQKGKSKIDYFGQNDEFSYVCGSHTLYPNVVIIRTIIYLKTQESIILHDKIRSAKERTYSQIFNIGKEINVQPVTKKKVLLRSNIDNKEIELLQLNHVTEFKNYSGEKDPIRGWQSTAFNKKHPISQLQFSNKGTDMDYKTIINLNTKKLHTIKNYSVQQNTDENIYNLILKNNERKVIRLNK